MVSQPTENDFDFSFYEDLRDFFSPILLVNYIISSLLICMVGLQIVAVNTNLQLSTNNGKKIHSN